MIWSEVIEGLETVLSFNSFSLSFLIDLRLRFANSSFAKASNALLSPAHTSDFSSPATAMATETECPHTCDFLLTNGLSASQQRTCELSNEICVEI